MAYTTRNFKTRKAMKAAFDSGEKLEVYQPGGIYPLTKPGNHVVEGPHYPQPHRWYVKVHVDEDGIIDKVF